MSKGNPKLCIKLNVRLDRPRPIQSLSFNTLLGEPAQNPLVVRCNPFSSKDLDWLTSPETQTMFHKDFGTAPMNTAADDSAALIPNEQRAFRQTWGAQPFRGKVEALFIDNVILER